MQGQEGPNGEENWDKSQALPAPTEDAKFGNLGDVVDPFGTNGSHTGGSFSHV